MIVRESVASAPPVSKRYEDRLEGPDKGVINAWLAGLIKRREAFATSQPTPLRLVARAEAGELPVLPYRGGVEVAIKRQDKIGSLLYVAMWLGLRGEDLLIDTDSEPTLVCQRTGVPVLFTLNTDKMLGTGDGEG